MNRPGITQIGLRLRLALSRSGWIANTAGALCLVGALGWLWAMPRLHEQTVQRQYAMQGLKKTMNAGAPRTVQPKMQPAEQRLHDFYDALGESHYPEQQVKTLFSIAAKNGLSLTQAEYTPGYDQNGGFRTYRILLPIKGRYPAVRRFCEQVLMAIPFASLDEIDFKRQSISNPMPDVRLSITLYLQADAPAIASAGNAGKPTEARP
ncbi:MAG: hypothetical protein JWP38_494 [Herbaspirillum sp.]|jgi:hypothetical protein|nr:hypothetical protein [Herbaspirillum sp.]